MAMFTLYQVVKRSVAETGPDQASVHTRNATLGTISAPEQDYFAPLSKGLTPETQRSTCSCSHRTGSVSATLCFTIRYSVNKAYESRLQQIAHTMKFTKLANMITLKRSFIVQSQKLVIAYTRPQVRIVTYYFNDNYKIKQNTTMNVNRSQKHGPI